MPEATANDDRTPNFSSRLAMSSPRVFLPSGPLPTPPPTPTSLMLTIPAAAAGFDERRRW